MDNLQRYLNSARKVAIEYDEEFNTGGEQLRDFEWLEKIILDAIKEVKCSQ